MGYQPKFRRVPMCIFCGDRRAKSQEHAWSNWAIQRFATDTNRIADQIEGLPYFDRHQKSVKVRCVCVDCNKGWMKGVEDAVLTVVERMAADHGWQKANSFHALGGVEFDAAHGVAVAVQAQY